MEIVKLTKPDFDQILTDLDQFWGNRSAHLLPLHHPIFLYEFGETAFIIREEGVVISYLLGFIAPSSRTAYVHLVGVKDGFRKRGLATLLYKHFIESAQAQDCTRLKAITTAGNQGSIEFHKAMGMKLLGVANESGIPLVKDYSGPGQDRVVFEKNLLTD